MDRAAEYIREDQGRLKNVIMGIVTENQTDKYAKQTRKGNGSIVLRQGEEQGHAPN